jgi:hypothetical protein
MIRRAFTGESISCTWVFEWQAQTHHDQKNARQMKSKVKSMLTISFDIKRTVHKEFILADQNSQFCTLL